MAQAEVDELQRRASAFFRDGDVERAIPAYEDLLDRAPNRPNAWFNLAILYRRAGRSEQALATYDRALEFGIAEPEEVHLQCGVIHAEDRRDGVAARRCYDAALALNPNYLPALLNMGNLQEDFGRLQAAREAYRRVLEIAPDHPLAVSRLLHLPGDPEQAALMDAATALLKAPDLAATDRADLGFALGAALDRAGDYDRAFVTIAQANQANRRAWHIPLYDRAASEELTEDLIAAFPATGRAPGHPETDPDSPIFICGMFRSGSTLMEQIFGRHSGVSAGGEIDFIPHVAEQKLKPYPQAAAAADASALQALRAQYLAQTQAFRAPGTMLIDKRPDNVLHIGLIKRMFPAARIIIMRRNPLDNCLSVYFLQAGAALPYADDLADIAHQYQQQARLAEHWRGIYGDDILTMDYDLLVGDPEPAIARALAFCGLPWEAAVLSPEQGEEMVRTASVWQTRQPIYRSASGRWRHYTAHIGPLLSTFEAARD